MNAPTSDHMVPNRKANGSAMQALINRVRLDGGSVMRTYIDAKAMAKSLRNSLGASRVLLSHSKCLEIVAKQFGFADWNTLAAKLQESGQPSREEVSEDVSQPARLDGSQGAAPAQLSCSFCAKTEREVRRLIEGGCSNRGTACVFICDECVAFCAQISAENGWERTSAGGV